jgi:hypothetical protein
LTEYGLASNQWPSSMSSLDDSVRGF